MACTWPATKSPPDMRSFGYKGQPDTCLWCGQKLHRRQVMASEGEPGAVNAGIGFWVKPAEKPGAYQDGFFCTRGCGYQFGLRFAQLGRRLQDTREETP